MVVDGSLVWAVSFVGISLLHIALLFVYASGLGLCVIGQVVRAVLSGHREGVRPPAWGYLRLLLSGESWVISQRQSLVCVGSALGAMAGL